MQPDEAQVDPPVILAPEVGPNTLRATRWAGIRLGPLRGAMAGSPIGESWEFSTLPGHESRAHGRPLTDVLGAPLPFLAKLIDTSLALSIQVHPEEDTATATLGKEEAWIVLDAERGAKLLVGLREGTSETALATAVRQTLAVPHDPGPLVCLLSDVEVERGTCVVVPAGTVHAIGPGILLAEIQQPIDRTYRLFDWGSDRALHVEDALAATRVDARPLIWHPEQPCRPLVGKYVTLEPIRGESRRLLDPPLLIVSVTGEVVLRFGHTRLVVERGALRLVVGSGVTLEVAADGLAVLGRVRAP